MKTGRTILFLCVLLHGVAGPAVLNAEDTQTYQLSDVEVKPKLIQSAEPALTPDTRFEKGTVKVLFVIGTDGTVSDCSVQSSTNSKLDALALDCVRAWKFEPGTIGGTPVAVKTLVPIRIK